MHASLRAPSQRAKAFGIATAGLLTLGVLGATAPAQDAGRERQPVTPEAGAARARTPQAGADADLANRLTRLHQEFTDRFREAVRGAQDERFAGASGQDVIITMLHDRVVAGFPTDGSTGAMRAGDTGNAGGAPAGETPGSRGGQQGRDAGDDPNAQGGAVERRGQPGATGGAASGDQILGVIIVGGQSAPSTRPIDAGAPVGGDAQSRRITAPGAQTLAPGVYEVRWMGGDLVALVDRDGSPVLGTTVRSSGETSLGEPTGLGGAAGRGGADERGDAGRDQRGGAAGGQGAERGLGGQTSERGLGAGGAMGEKPAWPRVYLAIVTEIASTSITGR